MTGSDHRRTLFVGKEAGTLADNQTLDYVYRVDCGHRWALFGGKEVNIVTKQSDSVLLSN